MKKNRAGVPTGKSRLLDFAYSYVGMTVRSNVSNSSSTPSLHNPFLSKVRLAGSWQWDGLFVETILDEVLEHKNLLPRSRNTSAALAFYIQSGWLRTSNAAPTPGDIGFFSYGNPVPGGTVFTSPRIAIISDVTNWEEHGSLQVIEGNVNSGLPRGSDEWNGVFERTRYASDLIGYVNIPQWMFKKLESQESQESSGSPDQDPDINISYSHTVRPAHLERCSSRVKSKTASAESRKSVEIIQLALAAHPGVRLQNADRGVFNAKTRAALAAFQRFSGQPSEKCMGSPDVESLKLLAASPYVRSTSTRRKFSSSSFLKTRRWRDVKFLMSAAISVPIFEVKS